MIKFITYCAINILLIPILTLLHELGHAIFALILTEGKILIQIGNGSLDINKNVGRLYFEIKGYKSPYNSMISDGYRIFEVIKKK